MTRLTFYRLGMQEQTSHVSIRLHVANGTTIVSRSLHFLTDLLPSVPLQIHVQ